jgi:hypothetical protein
MIKDDIFKFIESIDSKSLSLIIEKDNIVSEATLSILDKKIYFNTLSEDGTIAVIDSVSITTYDFDDKIIIIENTDSTFLDIFNINNFSNYTIIEKKTINNSYFVDYEFNSIVTSIEYNLDLKRIISIAIKDQNTVMFKANIKNISKFSSHISDKKFESWSTLDWRENG